MMNPIDPACPSQAANVPAITPDMKRDPNDPNQILLGDEDVKDDADE